MHAFVNLNDMNKLILILHDKMMLKVITPNQPTKLLWFDFNIKI